MNSERKQPPAMRMPRVAARSVFDRAPPSEESAVAAIANSIVSGSWKTGSSVENYAKAWGISEIKVREYVRTARVALKLSLEPTAIIAAFDEALQCMFRQMHAAEASGETREAMFASKAILDTSVALLKSKGTLSNDDGMRLEGKAAFDAMVEMGWQPPNTLRGLPAPTEFSEPTAVQSGVDETPNKDGDAYDEEYDW